VSTVVVTGASAFIGREVLGALADSPFDVIAVCRRPPAATGGRVRWQELDLMDPAAVRRFFSTTEPTHLMHLAWCAGSPSYRDDPDNRAWARASASLAHDFYEHGGQRSVFAGTSAEYQAPETRSLYAQSKIAAAAAMSAHAGSRGRRFAWGRIFLPYGPHDAPHRLVPSVIDALLAGRTARCSPGQQVRDFIHVGDVASALVTLLRSERDGPVDVGTGQGATIRDVAQELARLLAHPELVRFDGAPPDASEPSSMIADASALRELGWQPRALEVGLAETIAWHRARSVA
jgi:nucleoside-diphosphate-sugar epimerase